MSSYNGRGLHGQVVEAVGRRIVQGEYLENETIDLEALQSEHGVSLTVVRETLKVLSAKGLVDARQKRGTFVQAREHWNLLDPDVLLWELTTSNLPRMLEQLTEVRAIFEPAASALAAVRRDDSDIEAITSALTAMRSADNALDATQADLDFHHAVLAATKNDLLERVELLTRSLLKERDRLVHQHVAAAGAVDLHSDLVDAIVGSDPEAARAATERLLGRAAADNSVSIEEGATHPSTLPRKAC